MSEGRAAAGARFGPYEVVAALGAGGMGVVYRARDGRLGREVALKVLPPALAADADRRRRFEREARAVASLGHPNVVALHDAGVDAGSPWIAFELLQGANLRERLARGALPPAEAARVLVQVARALAAAHAQGILHRDLKPENVFLTRTGPVKVLDFGLARLTRPEAPATGADQTLSELTAEGAVLGTAAYMSPEQVRGEPTDERSDLFALGALAYEMLCGRRAFQAATSAETMTAILREEPPEIDPAPNAPLLRIARRCLEKAPAQRFQSAADVAFAVEALGGDSAVLPPAAPRRRRSLAWPLAAGAAAACAAALAVLAPTHVRAPRAPEFRRLTFRPGSLTGARFAGGQVVYSAAWGEEAGDVYVGDPAGTEARALGQPEARLLGVSRAGEMALLLRGSNRLVPRGTLARQALSGAAARELAENVQDAAWSPAGELAVVRWEKDVARLEYPLGRVLYEARPPEWIERPTVSPDGGSVAFLLHDQGRFDQAGGVAVVDPGGRVRKLVAGWTAVSGLAWPAEGLRVSGDPGAHQGGGVFALGSAGAPSVLVRGPDSLVLFDVREDGALLVAREHARIGAVALPPGAAQARDLSWLDGTWVRDLSADGRQVLFDEEAEGGGARAGVYLRPTDGGPAVRLGDGHAVALSPDGRFALAHQRFASPPRWVALPTGAGEAVELASGRVLLRERAAFFPDGRRVLAVGNEPQRPLRTWAVSMGAGEPVPLTAEGVVGVALSPDGRTLVARLKGDWHAFDLSQQGADRGPAPGLQRTDAVLRWTGDGGAVLVAGGEPPTVIERVDAVSGRRTEVARIPAPPRAGLVLATPPAVSADGTAWAYTRFANLMDLFLVQRPPAALSN